MIRNMDMENSIGLMVDPIEAIGPTGSNTEEESIVEAMVRKERENGSTAKKLNG